MGIAPALIIGYFGSNLFNDYRVGLGIGICMIISYYHGYWQRYFDEQGDKVNNKLAELSSVKELM